eukprot:3785956-Rhodomonas_salina.2
MRLVLLSCFGTAALCVAATAPPGSNIRHCVSTHDSTLRTQSGTTEYHTTPVQSRARVSGRRVPGLQLRV